MKKTLGLSAKQWKILFHYPMLAALLTAWYTLVHPPLATTPLSSMFLELSVLLLAADQFIHKLVIGVD